VPIAGSSRRGCDLATSAISDVADIAVVLKGDIAAGEIANAERD
jgi:hypothetical protein